MVKKENKKYYLTCKVSDGMFSNEKIVSFTDINGTGFFELFPSDLIKDGKLEIIIEYSDNEKSLIRSTFPRSGDMGSQRSYFVKNELISYK